MVVIGVGLNLVRQLDPLLALSSKLGDVQRDWHERKRFKMVKNKFVCGNEYVRMRAITEDNQNE